MDLCLPRMRPKKTYKKSHPSRGVMHFPTRGTQPRCLWCLWCRFSEDETSDCKSIQPAVLWPDGELADNIAGHCYLCKYTGHVVCTWLLSEEALRAKNGTELKSLKGKDAPMKQSVQNVENLSESVEVVQCGANK